LPQRRNCVTPWRGNIGHVWRRESGTSTKQCAVPCRDDRPVASRQTSRRHSGGTDVDDIRRHSSVPKLQTGLAVCRIGGR
jgi:hypothetical protein